MDTPISPLFDPSRLPARSVDGWVEHPDLQRFYDDPDPDAEGVVDIRALLVAGWEVADIGIDRDADPVAYDTYFEDGEADCSAWTPALPQGFGWLLAVIYEHEDDGPSAFYVRQVSIETSERLVAELDARAQRTQRRWGEPTSPTDIPHGAKQ